MLISMTFLAVVTGVFIRAIIATLISIGVLLFSLPVWEELILVCFLIGLYAIFAGITLFTLAFTLRSKKKQVLARSTR